MEPRWKGIAYRVFLVLLAGAVVGKFVFVLKDTGQFHTAALYVGVPTLLAVLLGYGTRGATGVTKRGLKWTAIALLLSMPAYGAGAVCVVMAAPIFFTVVALVCACFEGTVKRENKVRVSFVIPILALLSFEGTTEFTTVDRFEVVSVEKIVASGAAGVEERLAAEVSFDRPLPLFLRLFPNIVDAKGAGLDPGDRRIVRLVGERFYETIDGSVVFEVDERHANKVRFVLVQDDTMIARWLTWRYSEIAWQRIDDGHTRVIWTLAFERRLDPYWYFGPLERYGVSKAAEALIDNVATPRN